MNATVIEILVSLLLVALPWAFGGVLPWCHFAVEGVATCLALAWVISLLRKERLSFVATAILQLSVFAFGYFALTLTRLPAMVVRILSPGSAAATRALESLGVAAHPSYRFSMDPMRTLNELLLMGAYFVIFIAVLNTYGSKARIRRFLYLLVGNGVLLSVFALVQRAFWNGKMFWVIPTESGTSFGTYFNHNHFAGYVEMSIGALVAITLSHFAVTAQTKAQGWRRKLAWVASRELPYLFWGLFLLVVLVTATVYSLSRGALLSLALSLVLTKLLLRSHRQSSFHVPILPFVIVLVLVAALALVGASTLVHRFSNLASYPNMYRFDMWQDAARMVKDFPLFGVGLGVFNEVFPAYKNSHFEIETVFLESDWLQALVECGVVGMTIIVLMLWVFFKNVAQRYTQRRDRQIRSFMFGGTIGVVALVVHALLDFNMHIPANALTFIALAAVVLIAGTTRDEGERSITPTVVGTLTSRSRGFLLLTIGSMSLLYVALAIFAFRTQDVLYRARGLNAHRDPTKNYTSIFERPRTFLPLASEWHFGRANTFEMEAAKPSLNLIEAADLRRQGLEAVQEALLLCPGNGKYWSTRARLLSGLGEEAMAGTNFAHAVALNRSNYELFYFYGVSLLRSGKVEEGILKIGHARTMANVFPLDSIFNFVLFYTHDPRLLSLLVTDNADDRAMFKVLLERHHLAMPDSK